MFYCPQTNSQPPLIVEKPIIGPILSLTLLQIYCTGLIGPISFLTWVWAMICDATISVFEKNFISYSCILFIKYYALRSFCIKLLCFSKIWFFQIFDRLNLVLDRSKLRLKFCFESAWFDRCSIAVGSFECIFDRSNLFFDQSKIA